MGAACLALSLFAILLWGKLKLVTGAPRTAYADPKGRVVTVPYQPGPAGGPARARERR